MLAPIGRLDVQVHLGEVVQRQYTYYTHHDCGEYDLRDGPVLEEQLADEHVEFSHAAFLQEEAKRQTDSTPAINCGVAATGGTASRLVD